MMSLLLIITCLTLSLAKTQGSLFSANTQDSVYVRINQRILLNYFIYIHEVNSVIILVFYLCISINNILTLFIMTRPVHAGQVISTCILIN